MQSSRVHRSHSERPKKRSIKSRQQEVAFSLQASLRYYQRFLRKDIADFRSTSNTKPAHRASKKTPKTNRNSVQASQPIAERQTRICVSSRAVLVTTSLRAIRSCSICYCTTLQSQGISEHSMPKCSWSGGHPVKPTAHYMKVNCPAECQGQRVKCWKCADNILLRRQPCGECSSRRTVPCMLCDDGSGTKTVWGDEDGNWYCDNPLAAHSEDYTKWTWNKCNKMSRKTGEDRRRGKR